MTQLQEIPLNIRISLAHAYFQRLLERNGIDALHIKGYAFGPEIYREGRRSTDVDLLVRPAHVSRLMQILKGEGWSIQAHFETGSIFEHAATLYHPTWGLTDIHRLFPGLGRDPHKAFELLWEQRRKRTISNIECFLPSLTDSRMLVVLHAAKDNSMYRPDIDYLQDILSPKDWDQLRKRAIITNSEIAFDTALGEIELHENHPDYLLWKSVSQPVSEYVGWLARIQHAQNLQEKMKTLFGIFAVNTDHLAMELGHYPSTQEIRTKFLSRFYSLMKKR